LNMQRRRHHEVSYRIGRSYRGIRDGGGEVSQIPDYQRGRRDGIKWAITKLHEEARRMNDPHAKAVINAAAFGLGVSSKPALAVDAFHSPSSPPVTTEGE
jgi:hypothetical protein